MSESQNNEALESLYAKVKALRGVTTDIHDDVESQRAGLLSEASESFDAFASRLGKTSDRLVHTIRSSSKNNRLLIYTLGAVVALFVVYHFLF